MPQWVDDFTPKPYVPQWVDDPPNYQPPPPIQQSAQLPFQFANAPVAPKEQSTWNWWLEQAARNIPPVVGGFVGGVLGLPEGGIGAIPGAMAGGAAGSAIGNLAGNWVSGKEFQPAEFAVDTALGAIPPIFGPPKVAGLGIKELAKYAAKSAGMGALEGGLVSAGSTPFQHAARTGSFDAPLEEYAANVGTGAGMGAVLGGGLGYFHGRGEQAHANAPIPPAPPLETIRLPEQPANPNIAPNLTPPSSQGPHLVTIKDYSVVPYWKEKGYVIVPGLKTPDGYQQMARADVAPMYRNYKDSKIKPTELNDDNDVLNLIDQLNAEEGIPPPNVPTRDTVPGAIGEGYVAEGAKEVTIPNDIVNGPFIQNMRESGFQIADKNSTHTIFKPLDPNMHVDEPPVNPNLDELFDKLRTTIDTGEANQPVGEVESRQGEYDASPEMTNILAKVFMSDERGSLSEFEIRKHVRDILTTTDSVQANNLSRLLREKGHDAGTHADNALYNHLADAAELKHQELGGSWEVEKSQGIYDTPTDPAKLQQFTTGLGAETGSYIGKGGAEEIRSATTPEQLQDLYNVWKGTLDETRNKGMTSGGNKAVEMIQLIRERYAELQANRPPPQVAEIPVKMGYQMPNDPRPFGGSPAGQVLLDLPLSGNPELDTKITRMKQIANERVMTPELWQELRELGSVVARHPDVQPGFRQKYYAGNKDDMRPLPRELAGFARPGQTVLGPREVGRNAQPGQTPPEGAQLGPRGVPEEGGLDVAGIRQRNLFGERPAFEGSEPLFPRRVDKPDEIPSANPGGPPPPKEELTPLQRRRKRILTSLRDTLPDAPSWLTTRFVMPDGTRLTHEFEIHEQAANAAGTTLDGVLESGVLRVGERFYGVEARAPITMRQAEILADSYHHTNRTLYVEAYGPKGAHENHQFPEDVNARAIYNWVNRVTKRSDADIAHLESRADRLNAIDTWESMSEMPRGDSLFTSVIYDRNQKLTYDEMFALKMSPLAKNVHLALSNIIDNIAEIADPDLHTFLSRIGTVIDPAVKGLFKKEPEHGLDSAVLINWFEHIKAHKTPEEAATAMMETIYHELAHVNTGAFMPKFDPRKAMQDPTISKGIREYIRQLVMNGEADPYHNLNWMARMIDLQQKMGAHNAEFEKQLAQAFRGSESSGYSKAIPVLLQQYTKATGRETPTVDSLSTAGIEQASSRQAAGGSVPSNAGGSGGRTPPIPPPGSSGGGGFFRGTLGWGQGATKGGTRVAKDEVNWVKEAMAVPSSVTTTGDLSFPGRQGLSLILTPQFWQAAGKMFKGGLSQAGFDAMNAELAKKPLMAQRLNKKTGKMDQSLGEELGLRIYKLASQGGPHAEGIASRWLERGIGKTTKDPLGNKTWNPTTGSKLWENSFGIPVKSANRAFLTMLNQLSVNRAEFLMDKARDMSIQGLTTGSVRPGIFSKSVNKNEAMDLNPYYNKVLGKEIIDFVNTATGHGPLRTHLLPAKQTEVNLEGASKVLSSVLFSPGLLASRIRFMNPSTYIMASPYVRKQYMKSALATVAAWYGFTEMAKLAGGDQVEVSNDPTSADFGKVRIGDTRLDPGGGFLQFAVAYSRAYQGGATSSSTGQFHKFGEGYQAQTQEDMMERFMVNKLNPVTKFAYDVASASEYNPFHVADRTIQMFVPLFIQDLMEIYKEDPTLLPGMGTAAMFGMGTQIYSKGESVGKLIPPENDILFSGGGPAQLMPWNQN